MYILKVESAYFWYMELSKPSWAPPSWIFGPVWTVLYVGIAISFGYVIYKAIKTKTYRKLLPPFLMNLVLNFAFTPIQFGLKNNFLALLDILLVLATLVWALKKVKNKFPWVFYMNIPYLLWVTFASYLQLVITYLNI